ncbi:ABC transporter ATP-binding protein [Tepidiforma sp.]|uniref:ABC transporter ATP-binding protein n=1 Tax=Tepidiforma sp. TaxID=2682230 RepID=UPI00262E2CEC|nr:ABC transporter ATP-binding protein [Tepidiforma sp.]MCX7617846.1 ABC transporter ATP-binding protein [Tepidiforma sp.]
MSAPPVLALRGVTKRYRNGTLANAGIDLELRPGEIFGLLGPNGAGKTTLVRQVLGLARPTSGTITLDGVDIVADPGFARRNIGFLPQGTFDLQSLTVAETIEFAARLRGIPPRAARDAAARLIERLDLGPFRGTAMRSASGGVRRLAGFAAAIAAPARLLVLDEPTNDVDPLRRVLLWELISELGRGGATILLVTHNLAEAERVIDRLAIMNAGRIVREGTPAALRSIVTERLRLELAAAGTLTPHPALVPDGAGAYLFDAADLPRVAAWVSRLRELGTVLDFRIGPPTLDDIYAAAMAPAAAGRPGPGLAIEGATA